MDDDGLQAEKPGFGRKIYIITEVGYINEVRAVTWGGAFCSSKPRAKPSTGGTWLSAFGRA